MGGAFLGPAPSVYVNAVGSLDVNTVVDPEQGLEFSRFPAVSSPGSGSGLLFVGLDESPTMQRYRVTEEREFVLEDEVSFQPLGLQSAGRFGAEFVAPDKAYFIDRPSLTVVVWNPQSMTLVGEFSLDGLREDGLDTTIASVDRDGDRLVVLARYFRPDDTAAVLGRLAIIDSGTDMVVAYPSQRVCGNLAWSARDEDGNIYYASHPAQAGRVLGGLAGDPVSPPCMVRMIAGSDEFDPDYFVNLQELTGAPAGAVITGSMGFAYLMVFNEELVPITAENAERVTTLPAWEYYSVELGRERETFSRVPGLEAVRGTGDSVVVEIGTDRIPTPFIWTVSGDGSSGTFFDATDPTEFRRALTVPGQPGDPIRVR